MRGKKEKDRERRKMDRVRGNKADGKGERAL